MRKVHSTTTLFLIFILLFSLMKISHASALFPKSDTLFGITMPDISFAVGRDADKVEIGPEGELVIYNSFEPADYEAFGLYAKVAGLSIQNQTFLNNDLTFELEIVDIKDASERPQHSCGGCCGHCGGCH